jgi:hypothetical protein
MFAFPSSSIQTEPAGRLIQYVLRSIVVVLVEIGGVTIVVVAGRGAGVTATHPETAAKVARRTSMFRISGPSLWLRLSNATDREWFHIQAMRDQSPVRGVSFLQ